MARVRYFSFVCTVASYNRKTLDVDNIVWGIHNQGCRHLFENEGAPSPRAIFPSTLLHTTVFPPHRMHLTKRLHLPRSTFHALFWSATLKFLVYNGLSGNSRWRLTPQPIRQYVFQMYSAVLACSCSFDLFTDGDSQSLQIFHEFIFRLQYHPTWAKYFLSGVFARQGQ